MIWLGPLLGAVATGLFNRAQQRREHARQDTTVSRVVEDANRAGIHPLAALGSTAAGTYSTPVPMPSPFGDAVADGFRMYADERDRGDQAAQADELQQAQLELLRAQTRATDMQSLMMGAQTRTQIYQARAAATGGPTPVVTPGGVAPASEWVALGAPPGSVPPTNPMGINYPGAEGFVIQRPGAGTVLEDAYGDLGGSIAGVPLLVSDVWHNYGPNSPNAQIAWSGMRFDPASGSGYIPVTTWRP